ncbi:MAG: methylated-DNA--[protein]-cysteine S-methyltransferase [Opitutales bacterium]
MNQTHLFQTRAECFQQAKTGTRFRYGFAESSLGQFLAGWQADRLCLLLFPTEDETPKALINNYLGEFFEAFSTDNAAAASLAPNLNAFIEGSAQSLPALCLTGTDFQQRVWQRLLELRRGEHMNYGALAEKLGTHPRALGGAVGANPISVFVPCHRVVYKGSTQQSYRWGAARKTALQAAEAQPAASAA